MGPDDAYTSEGVHTLLALQLFVPLGRAGARAELLRLVRGSPSEPATTDKTRFWLDALSVLRRLLPEAHYGVWDYVDDDERALEEYQQWCDGTVEDALSAEPPRPGVLGYAFVTVLLLCDAGAEADLRLASMSEITDTDPWSRSSFEAWLDTLAALDWRSVKSDTLFVRPGDGGYGVSAEMLQDEAYHYLQPIL